MAPSTESESELAALRRELVALRLEVEALREERGARPRLRLTAARESVLLGQRIAVSAEVVDGTGEGLAGRAVTFAAFAGSLSPAGGLAPPAAALSGPTDGDGFARAELVSALDPGLGVGERAALEAGLAPLLAPFPPGVRFDPTAPAVGVALTELARQYRLDGNLSLRAALDACFRSAEALHPGGGEGEGGGDLPAPVWRPLPATLAAQVSDSGSEEPSAVLAGAVLAVDFYDWRGPFLEALRALARAESTLPGQLLDEGKGATPEALPGRLYDRVRRYVADERGKLGQLVARGQAEEALVGFLDRGTAELTVEQRRTLFPALALGSSALAAGGTATLAVAGQTRTDLKKAIDRKPNVDLGPLTNRLGLAEAAILVKADRRALDDALSGVETRLAAEATARGDLGRKLDSKLDRAGLDAVLGPSLDSVRSDLGKKVDLEANARLELGRKLDSQGSDLKAILEEERAARIELGRRIDQRHLVFDGSVGELKAALAAEGGARTDLAAKLEAEAAARSTLAAALQVESTARAGLATLLAAKADAAQVADLRARTDAATTQIASLQTTVRRIDTDVATIPRNPTIFRPNG